MRYYEVDVLEALDYSCKNTIVVSDLFWGVSARIACTLLGCGLFVMMYPRQEVSLA